MAALAPLVERKDQSVASGGSDSVTYVGYHIIEDWHEDSKGFVTVVNEDVGGSYEFDQFVVVKDPEGKLWAAWDAGCSCPTPFEDKTWPTDWIELRSLDDARAAVRRWHDEEYHGNADHGVLDARIYDAVKAALSSTT